MDRLRAMRVFVQVVDAGSFNGAAESLGLPAATVTVAVKDLEKALGARLLNRTTRSSSVTQDGAAYYEVCKRVLADLDEAEALFHDRARRPQGRLRIDAPPSIAYRILIPNLAEFRETYPGIQLSIGMGDRPVDLIQEAVDVAIRVGTLEDSSLVARRLGSVEFVICGSPGYFARNPAPETLADLQRHQAVRYFSTQTGRQVDWTLDIDGEQRALDLIESVAVNDADAYLQCGLHGLGLIMTPRFMAAPHLATGELVEILSDVAPKRMPVSIVYPQSRMLSPKVRSFVDWVVGVFERTLLAGRSDG
ncbi:LysR substrate-binding domain-containing protein [Burkholderia arboris]|uniref:LysR substrate-binding domain-containing protein n=1 Tax=Burkholderia arboris TaxID=488730 RepID=A0ABZ3DUZ4_9BURK